MTGRGAGRGTGGAVTTGLAMTGGRGGAGTRANAGKLEPTSATALGRGGNVGPSTRRTVARRTGAASGSRLIGDGRAGRSSRCALPTIAFFVTPRRRPISAVE